MGVGGRTWSVEVTSARAQMVSQMLGLAIGVVTAPAGAKRKAPQEPT
jgi:hypothetical protein